MVLVKLLSLALVLSACASSTPREEAAGAPADPATAGVPSEPPVDAAGPPAQPPTRTVKPLVSPQADVVITPAEIRVGKATVKLACRSEAGSACSAEEGAQAEACRWGPCQAKAKFIVPASAKGGDEESFLISSLQAPLKALAEAKAKAKVTIYVHPAISWKVVAALLHTYGMAGPPDPRFVGLDPEMFAGGHLLVLLPRMGSEDSSGPFRRPVLMNMPGMEDGAEEPGEDAEEPVSTLPLNQIDIELRDDGKQSIIALRREPIGVRRGRTRFNYPSDRAIRIPAVDGAADLVALRSHLERLARGAPKDKVTIGVLASVGLRWGEVAPVVATARGVLPLVVFGVAQ